MRIYLSIALLVAFVVSGGSNWGDGAGISSPQNRERDHLLHEMCESVGAWLQAGRAEDAAACDAAMQRLLTDPEIVLDTETRFVAAKIAWLRKQPDTATGILEDVVRQGGDENGLGTQLRASVIARLWQGTIYRHFGQASKADAVYQSLLNDLHVPLTIKVNCHVYLAELAKARVDGKARAVAELDAALKEIPAATTRPANEIMGQYRAWIEYQKRVLLEGKAVAESNLSADLGAVSLHEMIRRSLTDIPMGAFPLLLGYDHAEFFMKTSLRQALELSPPGSTDRDVAAYALADMPGGVNLQESLAWFRQVFEGDSYFAMGAGLRVVRCQEQMGHIDEAKATWAAIRRRFPGASRIVDKLNDPMAAWPAKSAATRTADLAQDREVRQRELIVTMCRAASAWLENKRPEDGAACDAATERLLKEETSPWSIFILFSTAKIAWLRDQPDKAAAILADLAREHGETVQPGSEMPVKVIAKLWLATIRRQTGQLEESRAIYTGLLAEPPLSKRELQSVIRCICHMYLADMEGTGAAGKTQVLAELDAALQDLGPESQRGSGLAEAYRQWLTHQKDVLVRGKQAADANLSSHGRVDEEQTYLCTRHFRWVGICGEDATQWGDGLLAKASLQRAIRAGPAGSVDQALATFSLGCECEKRDLKEALTWIGRVYEGESYFALGAGIRMARCQARMGEKERATATLARVKERFPGAGKAVELAASSLEPDDARQFTSKKIDPAVQETRARLIKEMCATTKVWLASERKEDYAACTAAFERLIKDRQAPLGLQAGLAAAKVAWLQRQWGMAPAILDSLVLRSEDENGLTSKVTVRLWLGTMHRHCGQREEARAAYKAVLKEPNLAPEIIGLCHIYLAELENTGADRKQQVAAELDAAIGAAPASRGSHPVKLADGYQRWIRHMKDLALHGKAVADANAAADEQTMETLTIICRDYIRLNGIAGAGVIAIGDDPVFLKASLRQTLEVSPPGSIDRDVAMYQLGMLASERDSEEALTWFSRIYEGDSYLALAAGMRMASCQRDLGHNDEARATFGQLRKRYSGVAETLDRMASRYGIGW